MTEEDAETLRLLKLRHYRPMPHGVTEALCHRAALLIERQAECIQQLVDSRALTSNPGGFLPKQ